ncbi:Integrase zinc binding domain [Popillia japonica]|uniref:RNA-directed DNA polymerase n=1 Tax=Popillia japonica TaxID=7064 RepID=A0AAW1LAA6_POPJA
MDLPNNVWGITKGADFWRIHGIIPDLRRGEWTFASEIPVSSVNHLTSDLDQPQHLNLENLINESFPACKEGELGCTNLIEYKLKVTGPPIKQRYYPISPAMQKIVNGELDEMLRLGVVQKSSSAWSSLILVVPKKDGSLRFCVDFRKVNQVTEKDAYPLPYIANTLDKLRNAHYLTSLDIKSGYWQIPLHPDSRQYTAFTIPNRGLFEFCRLPFGLTTAPSVFQRIIDRVIGADLKPYVFTYLDDIIIITPTFDKHVEILRQVFERLSNAEKVQAILKYERPRNVSDVRRFIGMTSCLLRKSARFIWDTACEDAFQQLKDRLVSAPVLTCPDFSKPFTIQCDASDYGIGAALTQQCEDGEKVICYLTVLFAIEKLRPYIEGSHFKVITDHYSLLWLSKLQNPSGRLARWSVRLQQYDFEIIHRKGKEHLVPDTLSRAVPVLSTIAINPESPIKDRWYLKLCESVNLYPIKYPQFRLENNILYKAVESRDEYGFRDNQRKWKVVVPKDNRSELLHQHHDIPTSGHLGVYKTFHRLANQYFWTASKVVEHLENDVFLLFGVPRKIVSDNGVQFRSKEYRRLLNQYQISSAFVSFYHPQSNPTERVNRVIKTMLIAYVSENHREWDKYLPKVACALRSAQHETTGHSPYYVNFGKEMRLLGSEYRITPDQDESNALDHLPQRSTCFNKLYMDVRARLQRAYEKSKHRYDLRHRPVSFYRNQVVWRKNFVLSDASKFYAAKLADKFVGPFLIITLGYLIYITYPWVANWILKGLGC